MSIYVSLLRGINVGTANRVAMADLRETVTHLGFSDVRTLLNSGNMVFQADGTGPRETAAMLETAMDEQLGVHAHAFVLSPTQLDAVISENPLLDQADDPSHLLVAVAIDPMELRKLEPLLERDWSPEALAIGKHAAYMWYPGGVIASKLNQEINRLLGDRITTRTWATMLKLQALAQE